MAELKATVTHAELMDWAEFYTLEPWGAAPADLRAGIVAATIANVHIGRDAEPLKPLDFMPRIKAEIDAQRPPEQPVDVLDTPDMSPADRFALLKAAVFGVSPNTEDPHHGKSG